MEQVMANKSFEVVVEDPIGLHARPAALIVKLVKEYGSDVEFSYGGATAKANSALRLMSLKIKSGSSVLGDG
jgi:phosphocarrier protein